MAQLGSRLRLARVQAGKTLREAEEETGLSKDTISRIERGLRNPQPLTAGKLAEAYGRSIEEFLEAPKGAAPLPFDWKQDRTQEEERRALKAWFSLGLVTEQLESLYTKLDELVRNAPDDPDEQAWRAYKARLEDHYHYFVELQASVSSRGIDEFLFPYAQAIQEGGTVPADVREVIDAYHRSKNAMNEDAIPRAGRWITEHSVPLGLQSEAEESPLGQAA